MAKPTTQPDEPGGCVSVWVVESFMHTDIPKVEKYTALSIRSTGATVLRRSGDKKFIPAATHRRFFGTEEAMHKFVRSWVEQQLSLAQGKVKSLTAFLLDPVKNLEVYANPSPKPEETP